ncbi:hypothetical protein BR63_15615 [Thermanaerosceptrum fracticalcis]|uniref:DRTGG domain-containing protein n=1 Tax=Thermanaerosceptrum fracticalcis TaxID=1712410 RepID=A0A7G6E670_THEFR|nr:DRTGG domain-containing protein [Thermanaerosceptrum fracticalcis]QNB47574.1 hypothetical protein BR63_15615 [Thermanaerosceptrum fracticalcis]
MTLSEIRRLLKANPLTDHNLDERNAETACGADLLSDVLVFTKEKTVLLTGLIHPQVIRTAEMLDLVGVVFVRGKEPSREIIDLAQAKDIPVLCTAYPMYESCGILYKAGLGGAPLD